ncbi:PD-(D/E)XK nuclease superfamily protein [Bacillus sp. OV166]|nr:PD-(D/E)XK nuclease superfamily protein [Bacillus sp. OV166]
MVEKERTLSELKKLGEVAGKMRGAIQWIKTAPWFESIGTYQSSDIPPVMNSDPRYRALYQLYRELKNEQFHLQIHQSYSYQWKRTDKLYEIWGYLQFIKTLAGGELGFVPEKGWLYSQTLDGNSLLVPTLPANTEVVFRKDELRMHLVYEALLPSQSRLTSMEDPLYTRGTHNCPDGRLDVYRNELFIGTIIFDFKYRPRNSIWNENLIVNNQQNEVMRQLVSYGDHLHSPYLFGDGSHPLVSTLSPVQEVWAIYPNRYGTTGSKEYPDHKVSLIELTPGLDHTYFVEKLKLSIDKLVKRSKTIMEFLDYIKV